MVASTGRPRRRWALPPPLELTTPPARSRGRLGRPSATSATVAAGGRAKGRGGGGLTALALGGGGFWSTGEGEGMFSA